MSEEKSKGQMLAEELFYKKKTAFEVWDTARLDAAMAYCDGYMKYLDDAKTEREAVVASIAMLEKEGFRSYRIGDPISVGDKLYYNNRGKSIYAMVVGTEDIHNGTRISAAHIDSP